MLIHNELRNKQNVERWSTATFPAAELRSRNSHPAHVSGACKLATELFATVVAPHERNDRRASDGPGRML